MAQGTVKWFQQAVLNGFNGINFNFGADTLKLGIVTTATVPAANTADPRWGAGGTTNFSTNQVATGGTSYTGPITLAGVTWSIVSGVPTLRATNVTLAQDASGFTNGAYGILYDDTLAGKYAIGYIELSAAGAASLVAGSIVIDWAGANGDILTGTIV